MVCPESLASKWPRQGVDQGHWAPSLTPFCGLCSAAWLAPFLTDSQLMRVAHQYVPKVSGVSPGEYPPGLGPAL